MFNPAIAWALTIPFTAMGIYTTVKSLESESTIRVRTLVIASAIVNFVICILLLLMVPQTLKDTVETVAKVIFLLSAATLLSITLLKNVYLDSVPPVSSLTDSKAHVMMLSMENVSSVDVLVRILICGTLPVFSFLTILRILS